MRTLKQATGLLALLAGVSCGTPASEVPPQCEVVREIPTSVNRNIDLLMVLDSSPAMLEEQWKVSLAADEFAAVMGTLEGGLPDLHLSVITTDVGVGSAVVPGCTADGDDGVVHGGWLRDVGLPDGTRDRNYSVPLADALRERMLVGTSGCRFSQPFEAVRRALDGSHAENQGFLRDFAYLFVLFITPQDDCTALSPDLFASGDTLACTTEGISCGTTGCEPFHQSQLVEDPGRFADFLHDLKEDPGGVLVSGIFGFHEPVVIDGGALQPSCNDPVTGESAQPGVRLDWLLNRFPNRTSFTSLCSDTWADALVLLANHLAIVTGAPCLDPTVDRTDLDPTAPGLQIDCQVTDVIDLGTDQEMQTVLPRCAMFDDRTPAPGNPWPCWWVEPDGFTCPGNAPVPRVTRGKYTPPGTTTVFRCSVADCP